MSIINASPQANLLGINDQSTRAQVAVPEDLPTHLPKIYIYAQKGPTTPQLVVGSSRNLMYGAESFNPQSKYFNHASELANVINAEANSQMIERIKPTDAGPNASIRLAIDLLQTQVNEYERNSDGSFVLDEDGFKVPTGTTIAGVKAKWVAVQVPVDQFGLGTEQPGDQTDGQEQSVRIPMFDLEVPDFGSFHNNTGLRMWAPLAVGSSPLDSRLLTREKFYPVRLACVRRASADATPSVVETMMAEPFVEVALKPDALDRANGGARKYIGDTFIQAYQELNSRVNPDMYGPFGKLHTYDDNIAQVLELVYGLESPFIDGDSDFVAGDADGEKYLINLVSGLHSSNVPYHAFELITDGQNVVRMSEVSTMYATGGSDGTMSNAAFAERVGVAISNYANPNSELQDTAKYPESIFYDSGFPLETKFLACNFIGLRKDTFVVLSTYDVDGTVLTGSQESSMALALKTQLLLTPESEYFGTPVCRGMVVGHSGRKLDTQYPKRLPLTLEVAKKSARYMGAGNGRWKPGFAFDNAETEPGNRVESFADVNATFKPAAVRNKDWDNGLVWVQNFQRKSLFFPAFKTVYTNDTSVLNSFFTAMACVELEKVGERAWRQFTGSAKYSPAQMVERVNRFITENTVGRFDGRYTVVPRTFYTEADEARGFSWTTIIQIYAPNMMTVMTLSIEAHRISELLAEAA